MDESKMGEQKITPEDVVHHLLNSVEGYLDDQGFYWSVTVRGDALVVEIEHDDVPGAFQRFSLTPMEV